MEEVPNPTIPSTSGTNVKVEEIEGGSARKKGRECAFLLNTAVECRSKRKIYFVRNRKVPGINTHTYLMPY
jgi:hypothetical protein